MSYNLDKILPVLNPWARPMGEDYFYKDGGNMWLIKKESRLWEESALLTLD